MKLIKPHFEIIEQEKGLEGVYKQIEIAGRTCYKSEDKIIAGTAQKFVNRMINLGHYSVLEHGTVYLRILSQSSNGQYIYPTIGDYVKNKYSVSVYRLEGIKDNQYPVLYVTTNYRVLVENDWLDDLKYQCEPTEYHEKRVTVKFYTQIAISREFNRHRVNSIAEQSTRYCNYNKDKFGGVSINIPLFAKGLIFDDYTMSKEWMFDTMKVLDDPNRNFSAFEYWLLANHICEYCYLKLISMGWTAQHARTVLPLDTNTELVHTAFISDWQHFFKLRDAKSAHPQAFELAHALHEKFMELGY